MHKITYFRNFLVIKSLIGFVFVPNLRFEKKYYDGMKYTTVMIGPSF